MNSNKNKFIIFFAICALESLSANLVHPVTPTFIINLGLSSSIFGIAYSCMAATNFLFSSFWGKLVGKTGHRKIITICCIGYAVGQYFFLSSTTSIEIIFARLFSGIFVGGIIISQLTYILKLSKPENKSKNLTILATILAVFAACGFLVGGEIGSHNTLLPFYLQVALLSLSGILYYVTSKSAKDNKIKLKDIGSTLLHSSPIHSFINIKKYLTPSLLILSIIVFISSCGTTDHDQTFNYYINSVFHLNSSYNGMIKAFVAIIGLIFNSTICSFIIRKLDLRKSLVGLFFVMTSNVILICLVSNMYIFMAVNIIYYGFNIVYVPLLQSLYSNSCKDVDSGILMGEYNSFKSLGMIVGALIEAYVYKIGPKIPFIVSGSLFAICGLILFYGIVTKKLQSK